jgi:hypothetical protein
LAHAISIPLIDIRNLIERIPPCAEQYRMGAHPLPLRGCRFHNRLQLLALRCCERFDKFRRGFHGYSYTTKFILGCLQRGRIDLGFIGGAEVDRFGNLNTNWTPEIRLPGNGGAADIASFARRTVISMMHEPQRFRERVQYLTSAGHGTGKGWRQSVGLSGGGPSKVVTSLGVFSFDDSGEMILTSRCIQESPKKKYKQTPDGCSAPCQQ